MSFTPIVLADWDVPEALRFYSRGRGESAYRDLSNFGPSPILLIPRYDPAASPLLYADVETAFQAAKACDQATHDWIAAARTPKEAKDRGTTRAKVKPPADWDQVSPRWMLHCLRAKYALAGYRELLLSTGDRILVEDSPYDERWGGFSRRTGRYSGQNLLGRALMLVRAELRGDTEPVALDFPVAGA
jgi:hypothetical protein